MGTTTLLTASYAKLNSDYGAEVVMESFDYLPRCNLCSRDISQVSKMTAGEECHVCNDCVDGLLVHTQPTGLSDQPTHSRVARLKLYRPTDNRH